jgi:hypothetical protein
MKRKEVLAMMLENAELKNQIYLAIKTIKESNIELEEADKYWKSYSLKKQISTNEAVLMELEKEEKDG